jgi:hypothetical protein
MRVQRTIETWIDSQPDLIFDVLIDLRSYDEWLPDSAVFRGTTAISRGAIGPGTTYIESSPWGIRRGQVVDMDRPVRISYHQPMTLRHVWMGTIDIHVDDLLTPVNTGTLVKQGLSLDIQGPARVFGSSIASSFVTEIKRMQAQLKAYVEGMPSNQ